MPTDAASAGRLRVLIVRHAAWADLHRPHPENVMAPLTLGYAVALLKQRGHTVTLVDTETGAFDEPGLQDIIRSRKPDMVVLEGITPAVPAMQRTARYVRDILPTALIVASGQHATARPKDFLGENTPFDAATSEEYEETLVDLAEAGRNTAALMKVAGAMVRAATGEIFLGLPRTFREDLDALPFPSHELFLGREYVVFHPTDVVGPRRWGFILTSRGCPYPCLHCAPTVRNSYGRSMRYRSPASIVSEMEHLIGLGATVLHFKDDIFSVNRDRTLALCEEIRRRGVKISWTVQTRADCIDLPLLRAMKAAGCCTVSLGIESGSPRVLQYLRKRETPADCLEAARNIRRAGLYMVNFYMIGSPTETLEEARMTFELARKMDPDILQCSFFTPYPGTPYYEEIYRPLDDRSPEEFSHYNRVINVSRIPSDELLALQRKFYLSFALRPKFIGRFMGQRLRALPGNVDHEWRFYWLGGRFLMSTARNRISTLRNEVRRRLAVA